MAAQHSCNDGIAVLWHGDEEGGAGSRMGSTTRRFGFKDDGAAAAMWLLVQIIFGTEQ
jgi:hypothetical protein